MRQFDGFDIAMLRTHGRQPLQHIAVAISGGGDSLALLHLLHGWAEREKVGLFAVTVNHGLRPESSDEAAWVAKRCGALGVAHTTLCWRGWDGSGNLQEEARKARYRLIAEWACTAGIDAIALGHTEDDQAETFLMRIARGSGVDGLSAMREDWQSDGARWLRPLLRVGREELRDALRDAGISWFDDPSNDDPAFGRVRVRQAMPALETAGITADKLAQASRRMSWASRALREYAQRAAQETCRVDRGDVLIDRALLAAYPVETLMRLWAHALMWISASPYRPRLRALVEATGAIHRKKRHSLHGCLILPEGDSARITREWNAVKETVCPPDQLWDSRWRLSGVPKKGMEVRALGEEGLTWCKGWRETGLPRASLMASPAIWHGQTLIAAPVAGFIAGWSAEIAHPDDDFFTSILSH